MLYIPIYQLYYFKRYIFVFGDLLADVSLKGEAHKGALNNCKGFCTRGSATPV